MNLPKIPVGERLTLGGRTWLGTPSGPTELYIGNFIPVQSTADRDALNKNNMRQGSWCYVIDDDAVYKLVGASWLPFETSGGSKTPLVHEQTTESSVWEVEHNFGYYPEVILMDENGFEFKTEIQHISINKVIINLNTPEKGRVQLK